MDRLGYLEEFERKCDELLVSNVKMSVERMEERDKLIRLAKSALKSRVVSNAEVKNLIDNLDEALFSDVTPHRTKERSKGFASLTAKSTLSARADTAGSTKVNPFSQRMRLDKRWL
jgi:hypothetical protein